MLWNHGELLEFQDDTGSVYWGWELEEGKEYSLIISARNGLLRYAMRDRIRVTRFHGNTPIIAFVGKEGRFINAVGEKVTEEQLVLSMKAFEGAIFGFTTITEWAQTPRIHLSVEWKEMSTMSEDVMARHFDACFAASQCRICIQETVSAFGSANGILWNAGVYESFRNWKVEQGAPDAQVKDCIVATEEEWRCLKRLSSDTIKDASGAHVSFTVCF